VKVARFGATHRRCLPEGGGISMTLVKGYEVLEQITNELYGVECLVGAFGGSNPCT
jgi:hypothetical protein